MVVLTLLSSRHLIYKPSLPWISIYSAEKESSFTISYSKDTEQEQNKDTELRFLILTWLRLFFV